MHRRFLVCLCLMFILGLAGIGQAHFGVILPDKAMVMQGDDTNLGMILALCHPMEQQGMDMAKPKQFGVKAGKEKTDLLSTLQETKVMDKQAWKTSYALKKPGIYTFYFDPAPYWEPAENKFIIHQTKTYVAAFGEEEGWGQEVGLKAEIVPRERFPGGGEIQGQTGGRGRRGIGVLERR